MRPFHVATIALISLLAVPLGTTACQAREKPPGEEGGANADLAAVASDALAKASALRGIALPAGHTVKSSVASKADVGRYLGDRLRATDSARLIDDTGRMLRVFGAVKPDFDMMSAFEKAATEQIAGYYDWEKRTLFVADWLPTFVQAPIMVHEATHALQDARFHLARFMTPKAGLEDVQAAVQALIEGDATLVMAEGMFPEGSSPASRQLAFGMMEQQLEAQIANLDIDPVIAESMIFPYARGLRFARLLKDKGGYAAVDAAYKELPRSTEQILHPEKYKGGGAEDPPQRVDFEVPKALAAQGFTLAMPSVLGELGVTTILRRSMAPEAAATAAAGWDGDLALLLGAPGKADAVVLVSVWDSEEDAAEAKAGFATTKNPPRALVQDGAKLAGIWGADVGDPEGVAKAALGAARFGEVVADFPEK
ncbi:MAG: hypothetical protein KC635_09490 [Myxococcales bacterium]|nr:hypothetical protein [Myxococcales bacterium]MCB9732675.1 hypothetical protein [Deltaproteobacteria bacterium]